MDTSTIEHDLCIIDIEDLLSREISEDEILAAEEEISKLISELTEEEFIDLPMLEDEQHQKLPSLPNLIQPTMPPPPPLMVQTPSVYASLYPDMMIPPMSLYPYPAHHDFLPFTSSRFRMISTQHPKINPKYEVLNLSRRPIIEPTELPDEIAQIKQTLVEIQEIAINLQQRLLNLIDNMHIMENPN